ncbi:undecaprenyl phosphate 4-deoxy-4-formamido-L-arabinose transferase [uncultured Roseburia sp.]|uniref:Bifunctional glycosyltransferase family 2/GtrA family protein n=1 Tax=Brotonthovivens ammoniilytica TaxID=2981725 RepID=A0ABT2TGL1_9FIRM|nr:bifunctional glycosyltransferase family 2/GtrA family protein [Brotonthovivens ammoniilytica]MCU6761328.1 bifunctional glycosyltransferase family 2/GtrA family protein [Brotonthovivens ammoniilytica]SCI25392.1 undecaprenyl phosphate 4-deoxy-4-formamido-L-arabinose transferase [uncultured Roseburia sp.]
MDQIVIIPALNPDECLKDIVDRNWELENQIIVVDDGSDEKYHSFFWELSEKCIVLHHDHNRGKGEAIKTALRYIKKELWEYTMIGIMDADGQHLADDMEKLLVKAAGNPKSLILGCREMDASVPWKSKAGNQLTKKVFYLKTGVKVSDTQTGLRAFSSDLLDFMLEISGERYEYEMNVLVTCAKRGIEIIEVPIQTIYHDKNNSCSHFRKFWDSLRIYKSLLKFSLVSFSSFLLDYCLFSLLVFLFPGAGWAAAGANIGARVISAGYNYMMNCHVVFHKKETLKTALEYLLLAGMILFINNMVLQVFISGLQIEVHAAKMMTEILLFLISWLIQREIIFKNNKLQWNPVEKSGEPI